ncbi:MAG: hypothetical protein RL678_320 [Pseudomonadota bacterium]|jgi:hypothetical protein
MKNLSLEKLKEHCEQLQPMQAEAHFRRFVARNANDLRGWNLLVQCLIEQRNFKEAEYTIDRLMQLHGGGDALKRFAIAAYFHIGAHAKAYKIAQKLDSQHYGNQDPLSHIVTLLHWLNGTKVPANSDEVRHSGLQREIYQFNEAVLPLSLAGIDVAFFLKHDWHHSIQKDIASYLRKDGVCCMFLRSIWEVVAARPKVLVVSDSLGTNRMVLGQFLPRCRIVYTRHGLGDKNFASYAAGQADVTCVSSSTVADEFSAQFMIDRARFWVTGFPQMDSLFRHLLDNPAPPRSRTVLVAPTFTQGLSAVEILGERLVESVRGVDDSIRIMIRPHPHSRKTHPALLKVWKKQAAILPRVSVHDEEDLSLMDLFPLADVMVSDVSSAGLAWLATDRPLVCITDPSTARQSPHYAPDGLEWRMHKAATHVNDRLVLRDVVQNSLKSSKPPNAAYLMLRHHLFGNITDGRASERVAMLIRQWLH